MTTVADLIAAAESHLGEHENPIGSNITTFGQELRLTPAQWCMQFLSHVLRQAGWQPPADAQHPGLGWSSVGFFRNWAARDGFITTNPQPGAFACFEWEHDSWPDHVGLYVADRGNGMFLSLEGNTGGPDGYDEVAYKLRSRAQVSSFVQLPLDQGNIAAHLPVLPPEPRVIAPFPKLTSGVILREWGTHHDFVAIFQQQMHKRGWRIAVDGEFGPKTLDVVHAFQKEKGLTYDGEIGPNTWSCAFTCPVT